MSVVYFLILIGILVTIHEFGHFLAAKLLDFHVSTFSIGFGRPIVRAVIGETDYRLGVIPLGGYVRIAGEDPDDKSTGRGSYPQKPLWQRLVVVFAGPAANLLLTLVIYFVFFAGHSELPAAVIGDVLPDSPAARTELSPGDRIVAIDDEPVTYFEEIEIAVQESAGNEIKLTIERGKRRFDRYIVPHARTMRYRDGTSQTHGSIGVTWASFPPRVGVIDPNSPAGRAGLDTGDLVVSVDGREITTWSELRSAFDGNGQRRNLAYFRGREIAGGATLWRPHLTALVPTTHLGERGQRNSETGLAPAEMFVAYVEAGSPADLAGLRRGDLITAADGDPMTHWMLFDQMLQSRPSHRWSIEWKRVSEAGAVIDLRADVKQAPRTQADEYGNRSERLVFGAYGHRERTRSEMAPIRGRLSYAASRAIERTAETVGVLASGLWAIVRGIAPGDMAGPMTVYRAASVTGAKGWPEFLLLIALISVSVALLNLLPIPGLDGGQVLLFALEGIAGGPLSTAARDRLSVVGLVIVGMITVLAIKNDVMRILLP